MLVLCGLCHPSRDPHPAWPLSPNNSVSEIHVVPAWCLPSACRFDSSASGSRLGCALRQCSRVAPRPAGIARPAVSPSSVLGGGEFF
uniref:Uncharacterized protein n=1 Tax=Rangifer tarandus platyrhynchus TaxID=3082113 RepID=A0ACB0EI32_RANTA|nr:unnamed protein product [Rangifer tarandus platyrhynchus]